MPIDPAVAEVAKRTPGRLASERIFLGSLHLHCVSAGEGQPVVLLHGFPEFWYSWRRQIPALVAAGFHVVAPDMRGYHESDRPPRPADYRAGLLVEDIARLIEKTNRGPAIVVGHDWGGIVAWRLAALHPEQVRKLAILNAPHPAVFARELKRNPMQWMRSAYVGMFQLPWLPERILRARNFALLERAWKNQPVHAGAFTDDDIAAYKRAFDRPAGLTAPLHYYRAAARWPHDLHASPQTVAVPTLVLWGEKDPFLSVTLTHSLDRWVADLRLRRVPDSSHWIQNDVPELVNQCLIEFFNEERPPA